jgi:hypothetical protein
MRGDAFQIWRRERELVEREMDGLIAAGAPASPEERQVRRAHFAALIQRREAAARNLLQSDRARRRVSSPRDTLRPGDRLRRALAGKEGEAEPAELHSSSMAEPQSAVVLPSESATNPTDVVPTEAAKPTPDVVALSSDVSHGVPAETVTPPANAEAEPPAPASQPTDLVSGEEVNPPPDVIAHASVEPEAGSAVSLPAPSPGHCKT